MSQASALCRGRADADLVRRPCARVRSEPLQTLRVLLLAADCLRALAWEARVSRRLSRARVLVSKWGTIKSSGATSLSLSLVRVGPAATSTKCSRRSASRAAFNGIFRGEARLSRSPACSRSPRFWSDWDFGRCSGVALDVARVRETLSSGLPKERVSDSRSKIQQKNSGFRGWCAFASVFSLATMLGADVLAPLGVNYALSPEIEKNKGGRLFPFGFRRARDKRDKAGQNLRRLIQRRRRRRVSARRAELTRGLSLSLSCVCVSRLSVSRTCVFFWNAPPNTRSLSLSFLERGRRRRRSRRRKSV